MKIINLSPEDDIVSICDRLLWAEAVQVLFVLPEDGGVLQNGLDVVRLRRYADRQRVEVGLVTGDRTTFHQARSLGVPAFRSITAAQRSRRGWWRGKRQSQRVGLNDVREQLAQRPSLSASDRLEMFRRMTPMSLGRRWLVRYLAIVLFCLTLSVLFVLFIVSVPGATLTIKPQIVPVEVEQQIVADPSLEQIDYANFILPARIVTVTEGWEAEVETTGTVEVPDVPARGVVLFVNLLEQEVEIPAGTRVSTSDGETILFQTVERVNLAEVVGSTAEVEVIAVEPGPQGNVEANRLNRVEGALATQVEVRNLEPLSGGAFRLAPAVSEADMERIRAQVLQFLEAVAIAEMESELTEREFLPRDSVRVVRIFNESFSHSVGEQTSRLTLVMRAEMAGTAVNSNEATGLAYERLIMDVPENHALIPETIRFFNGDVVGSDGAGRVTFVMRAEANTAVELPLGNYLEAISGQDQAEAMTFLQQQLPLRETPRIRVWPIWFDRVPYSTSRIRTEIDYEG